jgi:Zn-dependent protease
MGMLFGDPRNVIYLIPVVLLSLSFHEFSHAYISYKLGDPTAKNLGRLTLNPLKHLDILGTIMILVSRFGWAKPVPINPVYYKDRRKGVMLVSLAGPLSNILLAFIFSFPMLYIYEMYGEPRIISLDITAIIYYFSLTFYTININLAVFNILPIPPLDGSKILAGLIPSGRYYRIMQYENYIAIIFLVLVFAFPRVLYTIMSPFIWVIETAIKSITIPIISTFFKHALFKMH